ncbi:MAG: CHRD domain-containing protein [Acidobacteria bacterium]|nr:CHRD domain-containing protein [Acidobacteriota bacterium]
MVIYDSTAHTLEVNVVWSDLVGTTTVAHIHCCVDPLGTVGVATFPGTFPGFPVGVTSGSYSSPSPIDLTNPASYTATFFTDFGGGTAAGAESALAAGLLAGLAYLNIHTSVAPGGEIRDFLQLVPEPGTSALFAGAFATLAAYRLRRRSA